MLALKHAEQLGFGVVEVCLRGQPQNGNGDEVINLGRNIFSVYAPVVMLPVLGKKLDLDKYDILGTGLENLGEGKMSESCMSFCQHGVLRQG